ncbi:MAG: glycogen-binding domain-containing protein [Balneolaceae bacterium]
MKDQDNGEILRRFMDGELSADEECETLHMIADDREMREMLRFERALYLSMNKVEGLDPALFTVPEGFADRVMKEISASEPDTTAARNLPDRLKEKLTPLFVPRQFQVRPVLGMAAGLILALFLAVPLLNDRSGEHTGGPAVETDTGAGHPDRPVRAVSGQEEEVWIRFVFFDDEAETVAVAGDFNNWDPVSLDREYVDGKPVWIGLVPVLRGEQRYMFIKDGKEWVTDPLAEITRDDGFGNKNAVLIL